MSSSHLSENSSIKFDNQLGTVALSVMKQPGFPAHIVSIVAIRHTLNKSYGRTERKWWSENRTRLTVNQNQNVHAILKRSHIDEESRTDSIRDVVGFLPVNET